MNRLIAEALGTAILLATVIGSGIMAETLAGGNVAIALLGNTIPTGAILVVLITIFGPISGAHFNPAVTLAMRLTGNIKTREAGLFVIAQIIGGLIGMLVAHGMFAEELMQLSTKARTGSAQWLSEIVATFGLVLVIFGGSLYITAAYWFTASTSFANPAVTIARSFSDTFAGINPAHMPGFILAQLIGALLAVAVAKPLFIDAK